jgi:hypothetical protein
MALPAQQTFQIRLDNSVSSASLERTHYIAKVRGIVRSVERKYNLLRVEAAGVNTRYSCFIASETALPDNRNQSISKRFNSLTAIKKILVMTLVILLLYYAHDDRMAWYGLDRPGSG